MQLSTQFARTEFIAVFSKTGIKLADVVCLLPAYGNRTTKSCIMASRQYVKELSKIHVIFFLCYKRRGELCTSSSRHSLA